MPSIRLKVGRRIPGGERRGLSCSPTMGYDFRVYHMIQPIGQILGSLQTRMEGYRHTRGYMR